MCKLISRELIAEDGDKRTYLYTYQADKLYTFRITVTGDVQGIDPLADEIARRKIAGEDASLENPD